MSDIGGAHDVPSIVTPRLELVSFSATFLRASLHGRLADAAAELGAALPPSWPDSWPQLVKILADLETIGAWAANDSGIDTTLASIDPDNVPSLGVVEKLGFRHTGQRWTTRRAGN